MTDQTVTLRIKGDAANLQASAKQAEAAVKGIGTEGGKAGTETAKGMKQAEAATKSLDTAASGVSGKLRAVALASAAVASAAAVALVALAKSSIDLADNTAKMSQKIGVSVESLSTLQYAADRAGVSTEGLQTSLQFISRGAADAAQGTGAAKDAFEALGIKVVGTNGQLKASDVLLKEVAGKFSQLQDGTQKTALAMDIFGRSGAELIPLLNSGADGIAAMEDRARALGLELDTGTAKSAEQFNDLMADLGSLARGFGNDIARELLPSLKAMTADFVDAGIKGREASSVVSGFADVLKGLAAAAATVKAAVEAVVNVVAASIDVFSAASDGALDLAKNYTLWGLILKDTGEEAKTASQILEEFQQRAGAATSSAGTGINDALLGLVDTWTNLFSPAVVDATKNTEGLAGAAGNLLPPLRNAAAESRNAAKAARDAAKAENERQKALRLSEGAMQSLGRILTQQAAFLGGPAAAAALAYRDELVDLLAIEQQLAATNSLSAEAVAGLAQARENAAKSFAKDLDIAKKANEAGSVLEDILKSIGDTSFNRLIADIKLVGDALEEALEGKGKHSVEELRAAMGELRHAMVVGVVSSAQQGLQSLQSMSEGGSKAFQAMQVAIDALALVQGISAVLNQGTGDPYSAPVRMAAMAAAIAPLIANLAGSMGSFGGSSGFTDTAAARQRTQGTGTVLGDAEAKSESILNAMEITADATSELVGINRGMLRALIALQDGLDRAGGMLARGAGQAEFAGVAGSLAFRDNVFGGMLNSITAHTLDPLGILGGSSRITDQGLMIGGGGLGDLNVQAYQEQQYRRWRFGSRRTQEDTSPVGAEFASQFQLIIDSISETVRQGALALGLLPADIEAAMAAFRLEEIRISLKDLSAEEQQRELLAVFSSIFDNLAGDVVPFIEQFQRVGEGLGETLVRVATGVQVTQEALTRLGFSLEAVGPEQFAQISESLIEMVGGIDAFISGMQSFVENFAPEAHKFELLQSDLVRAFEQSGLTIPATRDGMWALMQSLDATTESGREQIATLLRLSGTADAYYSLLERNQAEQMRAVESQIQAIMDYENGAQAIRDELAAAGMSAFAIELRDINRWSEDARAELNATARAAGLQAAAESDLAAVHQVAANRAAAAIARLRNAAQSLVSQLFGNPLEQLESQIADIEAASQGAYQSQIDGINAVGQAGRDVYAQQLSALQSIQQWLDAQLLGDLSTLTPEQRIAEAERQFMSTLAAAQAGDTEALQRITSMADALLREGRDFYASGEGFTSLEALVRGGLQGLVNTGPTASPFVPGDPGGGAVGGYVSPELRELYEQRDALQAQQEGERRAALVAELSQMIRELIQATGQPLEEIAASIGVNLANLATEVGINLEEASAETAIGLANLARQLGVDVAELAANVGVSLGELADRQSLLNQALDATVEGLPDEFRAQLRGPLDEIRDAASEADANAAIARLTALSQGFPAGIRDQLAPFFAGLDPTGTISELGTLRTISDIGQAQLDTLRLILQTLQGVEFTPLGDGENGTRPTLPPIEPPVIPDIGGGGGGGESGAVSELRALREESREASAAIVDRLSRVEQAQRDGAERQAAEYRRTADIAQAHR